jgi:hypothetical protein
VLENIVEGGEEAEFLNIFCFADGFKKTGDFKYDIEIL